MGEAFPYSAGSTVAGGHRAGASGASLEEPDPKDASSSREKDQGDPRGANRGGNCEKVLRSRRLAVITILDFTHLSFLISASR